MMHSRKKNFPEKNWVLNFISGLKTFIFSYTHWAQGEPNDWNQRNEDCVSMYVQNGFWNDDICDQQYNGICMKRAQQENCVVR